MPPLRRVTSCSPSARARTVTAHSLKAIGIGKGGRRRGVTKRIPGTQRREVAEPRDERHCSKEKRKSKTDLQPGRCEEGDHRCLPSEVPDETTDRRPVGLPHLASGREGGTSGIAGP